MTLRFLTYWTTVLICGAASFGPSSQANAFDHSALAKSAIEDHIRPGYATLAHSMRKLSGTIERLCQSRTSIELNLAQAAFRNAVAARAAIEHLRFGPVTTANRYERLAFWPDPKGIGRRQVRRALKRQKPGFDDPKALSKMSVALQGLTALEIVLFERGAISLARPVSGPPFRCNVALAISNNLVTISQAIVQDWAQPGGYANLMLRPEPRNPVYLTHKEVTLELVQSYTAGIVFARDRKIEGPVGGENGPRPKTVEFRLSKSGRNALKGNVKGFENFYRKGGLRAALSKISPERVKRADDNFKLAKTMVDALRHPLETGVQNEGDTDRLITLSLAFSGARAAVGKGINQAAGLSLGFNAGDGD